jgi:hypothetical protein
MKGAFVASIATILPITDAEAPVMAAPLGVPLSR